MPEPTVPNSPDDPEARNAEAESGESAVSDAGSPAVGSDDPVDPAGGGSSRRPRRRLIDSSRLSLVLVAILAGGALFVGGFSLGARVATTPDTPASEESRFSPFWDVYQLIQDQFAGPKKPSQDQLVRAAIKGMMESLNDPFSYYESPSDFQNSLLSVGGQAEGIGVQVQLQPVDSASSINCTTVGNGCELAIVQPIPGSPAEAAGIQAADVIQKVDGKSLDGLSIDKVSGLIKGQKGTTVTITIVRGSQTFDVAIVRAIFNQPEVNTRILANGAVQYIHVSGINPPASSQFDLAVANAVAAGRKAFIVDLRGNGGGYVPDAIKMASEFIPSGVIVYQEDARGNQTETDAKAGGHATDPAIKVVVLMDKNTASAAEILAGALQARGRAQLIGTVSYGKGIVQEWLPLPNNAGGIHLTVARWLTPSHVWIQGKGLNPDVAASNDGARAGIDPQLDAGLLTLGFTAESAPSASPAPNGSPSPVPTPFASPSLQPSLVPSPS
jgi:carboxyl-terminal processing protease